MTIAPDISARPAPSLERAARVAVVAALAATTMLFASLASAYLVRRSFPDWTAPALVPWPFVLLACGAWASIGIEAACRSEGRPRHRSLVNLAAASLLYLGGAITVIVSIASGEGRLAAPHEAFVVLLLGVHVVHAILGGGFSFLALRTSASDRSLPLVRLVTHSLTSLLFAIFFLLFVLR